MFAIEANQMIDTLHDLYPSWNPTATQLEAIRHKLCQFPFADAKAAALETYEPGKRLAPVDAILAECRRLAKERNDKARAAEQAAEQVRPVVTQEESNAIWAESAAKGNVFAMQWCDRHNIAYEKEQIPF
jgi:hypothetical protein